MATLPPWPAGGHERCLPSPRGHRGPRDPTTAVKTLSLLSHPANPVPAAGPAATSLPLGRRPDGRGYARRRFPFAAAAGACYHAGRVAGIPVPSGSPSGEVRYDPYPKDPLPDRLLALLQPGVLPRRRAGREPRRQPDDPVRLPRRVRRPG